MKAVILFLVSCGLAVGCASQKGTPTNVLAAPAGTSAKAAPSMAEGDRLFHAKDWAGASQAYQEAVAQQPDLAEAHYNLAVALDRMGKKDEAKKHYIAAANLAPGHKVIWDSPPLRETKSESGLTHDIGKKSYQDSTYRGF